MCVCSSVSGIFYSGIRTFRAYIYIYIYIYIHPEELTNKKSIYVCVFQCVWYTLGMHHPLIRDFNPVVGYTKMYTSSLTYGLYIFGSLPAIASDLIQFHRPLTVQIIHDVVLATQLILDYIKAEYHQIFYIRRTDTKTSIFSSRLAVVFKKK